MEMQTNVFITHVDKAGPILKLWAQTDRESPTLIERTINQLTEKFNLGVGLPEPSTLAVGKLVCAKYNDDVYYRARILSLENMHKGEVAVQFADYGNLETITINNLRLLDSFTPALSAIPDQATDMYLAGIVSLGPEWCPTSLKFVKDTICYVELKCIYVGMVGTKRLIKLFYENMDFVDCLMDRRVGYPILLDLQKTVLFNYLNQTPSPPLQLYPRYNPDVPPPVPIAQMMVTPNMARDAEMANQERMAMRQAQARQEQANQRQRSPNMVPPPGMVLPGYPNYAQPGSAYSVPQQVPTAYAPRVSPPAPEPVGSVSFINKMLNPGQQYEVLIVSVDDGPLSFTITLKDQEPLLRMLSMEINNITPVPLSTAPMVGTRCLAQDSVDKNLNRAVIKNVSHDTCSVYYVDYGQSEDVPLAQIFDIPAKFVNKHPVMAMQITHGALNSITMTKEVKDLFKKYAFGKYFNLFVVPSETHHMKQYGILYENKRGVLDVILDEIEARNAMKYIPVKQPQAGTNKMVVVSFVEEVKKFYVQLEDNVPALETLMAELMKHCKTVANPIHRTELRKGLICCAQFAGDNQWYRTEVILVSKEGIYVNYVDFGNVDVVSLDVMKSISPELVACLPAQAILCTLADYQAVEPNEDLTNEFAVLTENKSLAMKVLSVGANGTLAVNLADLSSAMPVLIDHVLQKFISPAKQSPDAGKSERAVYRAPSGPLTNSTQEPREHRATDHASGDGGKYQRQPSRSQQVQVEPSRPLNRVECQQQQRPNKKRRSDASADWRAKDGGDPKWREGSSVSRTFTPVKVSAGETKAAQLVYVDTPECFYLQLTPDLALSDIMGDIAKRYESGSPKGLRSPTVGTACVARFAEDGVWYRAVVRSVEAARARVHFIDYGNEDEVGLEDVKEIEPAFLQFPSQGIKCALSGALPAASVWSDAEVELFTTLADGKPLEVRFVAERGDTFLVTVKDAETDTIVNDAFGPKATQAKSKGAYDSQPKSSYEEKPRNSYDDKPKGSYNDASRKNYDDKPRNNYEDKPRNSYEDKPRNSYEDKPRNSYEDKPRNSYDDKPRNSYDDKPRNNYDDKPRNSYDDKPKSSYEDRKPRTYDDKPKPPPAPPQVFASPSERYKIEELEAGEEDEVCVSWFIDPGLFYAQRLAKCDLMEKTIKDIQNAYRSTPANGSRLAVGSPCIAKYLADGSLCRAEIISQEAGSFIVRYVDFGNRERLVERYLWQIESRFLELPRQAIECSLAGVLPPGGTAEWPKNDDNVAKMFEKEKYGCTFVGIEEGKYSVALAHDGSSVGDTLIAAGLAAAPVTAPEFPLCPEEPIERALLAGQTLRVAVTYVEGVARFCVHLAGHLADIVQAQVDEFVKVPENMTAFPSASVLVGQLCLATADNEHWYRARITDPAGTTGVFVTFIDYGDGDEIQPDKMTVIPDWLAETPAQAVECSLSGSDTVTVDPEVEDQFKADLEGETVVIHVDSVGTDMLNVSVYSKDGTKLELVKHVGSGADAVCPLLPAPVLAQKVSVFVSSSEGDNSVWLQRSVDTDAIADLLTVLYTHYQEEGKGEPLSAAVGLVCAAKSANDEQWYRARVTALTPEGATVQYVDYGNSETLPADNLRTLDPIFLVANCSALPATLPVVNESAVTVDLAATTAEVEYSAVFARGNSDKWLVELFSKKQALSDVLQEQGLDLIADYPFTSTREELTGNPPLLPGQSFPGYVAHTDGPAAFYIQRSADTAEIEALQADLQIAVEIMPPTMPGVGDLCAALYMEDSAWYRARVLAQEGETYTVRFIDYGNTAVVDTVVKLLPQRLARRGEYAHLCSLNVLPLDDAKEFSTEAVEEFATRVTESSDPLTTEIISVGEINIVDLSKDSKSIPRLMIEAGLVEEKFPENTVYVSHSVSPAEFWIQLQSAFARLDRMADRMAEAEKFEPLTEAGEGLICAAQFVDDDLWYRAKVLGTEDEGAKVLFIDYGNSALATELRALPEALAASSTLARQCKLSASKQWTEEQTAKFVELAAEGSALFTMELVSEGDETEVKLTDEQGKDVEETLGEVVDKTGEPEITAEIDASVQAVEEPQEVQLPVVESIAEKQELESDKSDAVELVDSISEPGTEENVTGETDIPQEESVVREVDNAEPESVEPEESVELPVDKLPEVDNAEPESVKPEESVELPCEPTADAEAIPVLVGTPRSRPNTPYEDRIVPGSICRGLSEEELRECKFRPIGEPTSQSERVTPVKQLLDSIPEVQPRSCPVTPLPRTLAEEIYTPTAVRLRHNERIVPGSISSGSSAEEVNETSSEDKLEAEPEDQVEEDTKLSNKDELQAIPEDSFKSSNEDDAAYQSAEDETKTTYESEVEANSDDVTNALDEGVIEAESEDVTLIFNDDIEMEDQDDLAAKTEDEMKALNKDEAKPSEEKTTGQITDSVPQLSGDITAVSKLPSQIDADIGLEKGKGEPSLEITTDIKADLNMLLVEGGSDGELAAVNGSSATD